MSTHERKDWSDDPRITAYALGELEGSELEALLAEIDGDAQAAAIVEELRTLGGTLEAEFAVEAASASAPALTALQRERIAASATPAPSSWSPTLPQWVGIAATVLVVGGLGSYLLVEGARPLERAFGGADELPAAYNEVATAPRTSESLGHNEPSGSTGDERPEAELERQMKDMRGLGYLGDDGPVESTLEEAEEELLSVAAVSANEEHRQALRFEHDDLSVEDSKARDDADEGFSREQYARIQENPFMLARNAPLSTFSVDVDTASYSNVRRMLTDGHLPNPDAVRIEELVNYFSYDYPAPSSDAPFSVDVEVGSAPWAPAHRLVRIGLEGRATHVLERSPSNLVFLLDVSGSMDEPDKLPLLKHALQMLAQNLGEQDRVAIVVYAGASGLALPSTPCDQSVAIHMALERLDAGGSTNGGAGIELAYDIARRNFIEGGINRVILATDGDFNVGVTDDGSLTRLIAEKAETGVFLTVLGFGRGNLQDAKMEQLADQGNGNYAYIDSVLEARKVLVEQMGATLETIAKDVKLQVEFNPVKVQAYRLLGYENRVMAAQDFNDDTKDAGEIGAGHCVTALYEVVPAGVALEVPGVDPLKYQTPSQPAGPAYSGELLNLKLRYKQPAGDTSKLLEVPVVDAGGNFAEMSDDSRFAASVAAFGMLLRDSRYKGLANWEQVIAWARQSQGDDLGGYRAQFLELAARARELSR